MAGVCVFFLLHFWDYTQIFILNRKESCCKSKPGDAEIWPRASGLGSGQKRTFHRVLAVFTKMLRISLTGWDTLESLLKGKPDEKGIIAVCNH